MTKTGHASAPMGVTLADRKRAISITATETNRDRSFVTYCIKFRVINRDDQSRRQRATDEHANAENSYGKHRFPLGTAKLRIPRRNIIWSAAGWLIIARRPYLLHPLSPRNGRTKCSRLGFWKPRESFPSLILTNVSVHNFVGRPAAKTRFDRLFFVG